MAIKDKKRNFETFQGSTFTRTIIWKQDEELVDLTGYDLRMYIRNNYDSVNPLIELTIGSGITINNAAGGEFSITLTAAQTEALNVATEGATQKVLPFQLYVYDLEYQTPDGFVDKLFWGLLTVFKEVTYD